MLDAKLNRFFAGKRSVLVAFSGGVDSSVLAKAAYDAVGEAALAVTFDTPTIPRRELDAAIKTAQIIGVRHITAGYSELADEDFKCNPHNRCYYCKKMMAHKLWEIAREHSIDCVVEGTNAQDLIGHRPGYKALKEANISSPLAELGFTKDDVRSLAREYGLDYDAPANACLASRIPTGVEVTEEVLRRVEKSEDYLKSLGFTQVRVRVVGDDCQDARIEVYMSEFPRIIDHSSEIAEALPFRRISLDLRGYS